MNVYLSHWPRYVLLFKKEEKTDLTKRNFNCRFFQFLPTDLDYIKW